METAVSPTDLDLECFGVFKVLYDSIESLAAGFQKTCSADIEFQAVLVAGNEHTSFLILAFLAVSLVTL